MKMNLLIFMVFLNFGVILTLPTDESKTTNKSNSIVTNIEKPNLLSTESLIKSNSSDEPEIKNILTTNFNDDFLSENSNFTTLSNASYSLLGDEILNVNDPFYNKTDLINSTISNKNLDLIYDAINDTITE